MDGYNNIEPVLCDTPVSRVNYDGEVDIEYVLHTSWFQLLRDASWGPPLILVSA